MGSVRVDDSDTTFQAVVERAFASATGQDLGFDDHIISAYSRQMLLLIEFVSLIGTYFLRNSLSFLWSFGDFSVRHANAILLSVRRSAAIKHRRRLTVLSRLAERYSCMERDLVCCWAIELRMGEPWSRRY